MKPQNWKFQRKCREVECVSICHSQMAKNHETIKSGASVPMSNRYDSLVEELRRIRFY